MVVAEEEGERVASRALESSPRLAQYPRSLRPNASLGFSLHLRLPAILF